MPSKHEQPLPIQSPTSESVTPVARRFFLEMLREREQKGIATYGTSLQTHNGRDAIRDLMEELIDAFQYVVQVRMENDDLRAENDQLREALRGRPVPLPIPEELSVGIPVPEQASPDPVPFGVPPYYTPIMHTRGDRPCHGVAFYRSEPVYRGEKADISKLRLLPDLRVPSSNDAPRCGTCALPIDPYTTQDVDWEPHLQLRPRRITPVRPSRSGPLPGPVEPIPAEVGLASGDALAAGPFSGEESYPSDPASAAPTTTDELLRIARELRKDYPEDD